MSICIEMSWGVLRVFWTFDVRFRWQQLKFLDGLRQVWCSLVFVVSLTPPTDISSWLNWFLLSNRYLLSMNQFELNDKSFNHQVLGCLLKLSCIWFHVYIQISEKIEDWSSQCCRHVHVHVHTVSNLSWVSLGELPKWETSSKIKPSSSSILLQRWGSDHWSFVVHHHSSSLPVIDMVVSYSHHRRFQRVLKGRTKAETNILPQPFGPVKNYSHSQSHCHWCKFNFIQE